MTRADVSVRLLGPFEVRVAGRPVVVSPGRQRALLASLALSAGRVLTVQTLAERTWGSDLPRDPRGAVQNNVLRLRRALGSAAIRSSADGYLLDVAPDRVDACRFLELVRAAEAAEPDRSRDLLSEALGLWRGTPLGGVSSDSLERDYAPMLTERYLSAVEQRIDVELANGANHSELIAELRELTGRFPVRESLWVRLLTVLSRSGRRAEALAAYETVRELLADTLGSDPSADLRRLHQELLTADEPRAEPVPVRVPRQLPPRPAGFVGRVRELAELDGLLDRGTEAVAAIHGIGGIGKTTLAVHWAHRRRDAFPDGQLYLDLHGYDSGRPVAPEAAIGGLLRSLGVPGERIPADHEPAAALLRTELAGKRMLLLLDNARDVDQVRPLLPGSDCFVLVTSRSQLRGLSIRDGARRLGLRELTDAEATDLLATSLPADRVEAEPAAVTELLQLCGRLPLALRIAAERSSRYPDLPLSQLVADLRHRRTGLDALASNDPASDPRAVFSWSYDSLAPDLARAFRLLGQYPGGGEIGVPGAAALLDADLTRARGLLDQLTAVHLLEEGRPGHYQSHDLLREYAMERLAAEEPEAEQRAALRRVLDWYLHAANDARDALGFGRPQTLVGDVREPAVARPELPDSARAFEWFEAERANLVGAAAAAARHGFLDHGWQLSRAARDFLDRRWYSEDWLLVAEPGLECAERTGDPEAIGNAALALGGAYSRLRRYDEAEATLRVALETARSLDDPVAVSRAASVLGLNSQRTKDFDQARAYHQQAELAARRVPDRVVRAHALLNYGASEIEAGEHDRGIECSTEALRIYRELGVELQQALALGNLAEAYEMTGDHASALECCELALTILRRLEDTSGLVDALTTLGRVRTAVGQPDAARSAWREAIGLLRADDRRKPVIDELLASL